MQIHEPIDKQKKLNIIAIADNSDYGRSALHYGEKLAAVFGATLTVITNFGFALEGRALEKTELPLDERHIVRDDYFFPERLHHYADDTNTIMFVIGVDGEGKTGAQGKARTSSPAGKGHTAAEAHGTAEETGGIVSDHLPNEIGSQRAHLSLTRP